MNAPAARKRSELAILELRALYEQYVYREFRMSRFEEYDFYAEYRSFLQAENILTFHDPSGKLLALKPDITLSIVRSVKEGASLPQRLCYSETVYRAAGDARSFREIPQVGLQGRPKFSFLRMAPATPALWRRICFLRRSTTQMLPPCL